MAAVQCSKCTAERKGFRRELDSWRHRLIHCVGFETILEGIYGPMLMRDLNLFVDCEPEEVDDWSAETSHSHCTFCKLLLEKLSDQEVVTASPLSSPSDYSCQAQVLPDIKESAHEFLKAVFFNKNLPPDYDTKIPLVAQELMKKMIHQFAVEYASKCTNGNHTSSILSPSSAESDVPLDLTVSRTQARKRNESETDGALDLSKQTRDSSATSSSTQLRASGSRLPSVSEELQDVIRQRTTSLQGTVLESVLHTLCSTHLSLLHQILKAAHQEQFLSLDYQKQNGQRENHCCYGTRYQDKTSHSDAVSRCKGLDCRLHSNSGHCNHQSFCSANHVSRDSKACCNRHHHPIKDCGSAGHWCSRFSCNERCTPRKWTSCHNLAVNHSNNVSRSLASPPLLPQSSWNCLLSTSSPKHCCCHTCACHLSDQCKRLAMAADEEIEDASRPSSVLTRELCHSPPPPPLSPIPSAVTEEDERPPFLTNNKQPENDSKSRFFSASLIIDDGSRECNEMSDTQRSCWSEYNASGTLQDVMSRFNEKLENITPLDQDHAVVSTKICVSNQEHQLFPSTSQNLPFQADNHLTEIITRVLHTGSASDYNLSELFNRHEIGEPKSPNTRLRRRQEVLAAIAKPADDPTIRRQKLKIKRYFAMLDQSCNRRKKPFTKRKQVDAPGCLTPSGFSDINLVSTENSEIGENSSVKAHSISMASSNGLFAEKDREKDKETQAISVTEQPHINKARINEPEKYSARTGPCSPDNNKQSPKHLGLEKKQFSNRAHLQTATSAKERFGSCEEDEPQNVTDESGCEPVLSNHNNHSDKSGEGDCGIVSIGKMSQENHPNAMRRSTRHIVPPQRFSSYVTVPRKMLFAACFSESIFNNVKPVPSQDASVMDRVVSEIQHHQSSHEEEDLMPAEPSQEQNEMTCIYSKDKDEEVPQTLPIVSNKKVICKRRKTAEKRTNSTEVATAGQLRRSPRKLASMTVGSPLNSSVKTRSESSTEIPYVSPIKLMFISPIKDKGGVIYSLKSAGSGSGTQTDVPFDPYEEPLWSEKSNDKNSTSLLKVSPLSVKSTSSNKSLTTSPAKTSPLRSRTESLPLRSASSSPRASDQMQDQCTPTKRFTRSDSSRSPSDLVSPRETTPKRRPGRPKKLGPRLEQKAKRPIGRPRKPKDVGAAMDAKSGNGKSPIVPDVTDNTAKNLKVTVVYGRSRRNKRVVSEGLEQLQADFNDPCHAENAKSEFLQQRSKNSSLGEKKTVEETQLSSPEKESAPLRKPGRPAKVKITGISVTVTTVSPRQRSIQLSKEAQQANKTPQCKKVLLPEFKSSKELSTTDNIELLNNTIQTKKGLQPVNPREDELPFQSLRLSQRVRKPSAHFLHAVATSPFRSYSRSNALLRRSKQLLLTKASNERRQEDQQSSSEVAEKNLTLPRPKKKRVCHDMSRVAGVSVNSIFSPPKILRWWATSAEPKAISQELARRIQVISDTWVANETKDLKRKRANNPKQDTKEDCSSTKKSVVQTLFDCSLNKPRSSSMQELYSWFMETTETQSLAIVKKASSRNPFEIMHFPRSANKDSTCNSPQTERLRKHTKKFATTVPKSPQQHQQAQRRLWKKSCRVVRQLFVSRIGKGNGNRRVTRSRASCGKLQAALIRAKTRFLTQKEKERWQKRKGRKMSQYSRRCSKSVSIATRQQPNLKVSHLSQRDPPSYCLKTDSTVRSVNQTPEPSEKLKEQKLYSTAWSPETLKECRVFLRKINSPSDRTAPKAWSSCIVTLDEGPASTYFFRGRKRELRQHDKAVKNESKRGTMKRTALTTPSSLSCESAKDAGVAPVCRQEEKSKSPESGSTEALDPPPAKTLRQSRTRGMTGLKWRDFVFGN